MRVLFIGDIFGRGGIRAVQYLLPQIVDGESIDLVIANVENVSGGLGVTRDAVVELKDAGVQVMTSGNHVWKKQGIEELLCSEPHLLRPANYPEGTPGRGFITWKSPLGIKVGILNLVGRIFMDPLDCPFHVARGLVQEFLDDGGKLIVIDFHAEATSEKAAFAWYLDGSVSAIVGSHTHVQTADERILPKGTGFISDMGMTGAQDSVIGVKVDISIRRFLTGTHQKLEPAQKNIALHGVLMDLCEKTGVCLRIERIKKSLQN